MAWSAASASLRWAVAAAVVADITLTASAGAGEALDRVLARGTLVNAVDEAYPPFSYRDAKGAMAGFDIDVATEVAKRLGVDIEHVTPGWDAITRGRWRGRWEICVCSMSRTAEQAERLAFVAPYYHRQSVAVVRAEAAGIEGLFDLAGKRIAIQAGTALDKALAALDQLPAGLRSPLEGAEILRYDTEPLAIADLIGDGHPRLDAVVLDLLTANEQIADGKPLRIVGPLLYQPMDVAIAAGDPELAAALAKIIAEMHADGTLRGISERRFGIDVTAPPAE